MYASGLFSKLSLFTKMKLKGPLSRGSHFKIYFRSEYQGNRGLRQNFHKILFSKDRVLIILNHVVFQKYSNAYFLIPFL